MKKNKFILGVVACAFAALAMTGCSLTLGGDDRASTKLEEVKKAVEDAKKDAVAKGDIEEEDDTLYKLTFDNIDSKYIKTVDGIECIDCDAAEKDVTTHTVSSANIKWDNPLYGLTPNDTADATVSLLVYNTIGSCWDALLGFYKSSETIWNARIVAEDGRWTWNDGSGFINGDAWTSGIDAKKWVRVTLVSSGASSKLYYDDTLVQEFTSNIDGRSNKCGAPYYADWDSIAVALGFNFDWLPAGYVDEGSYISDIRLYSRALTAAEVADL
ncbi:MAG: LamG-like jellyroll fold domain-containing protein [Treponema sp.]|nr:LamG-like jellyroll fold domain-containing protein [Treponema sp.]